MFKISICKVQGYVLHAVVLVKYLSQRLLTQKKEMHGIDILFTLVTRYIYQVKYVLNILVCVPDHGLI